MSHWDNKKFLSLYHSCQNRKKRGTLSHTVNCLEYAQKEYLKFELKQLELLEKKRKERELFRQHPDYSTFRYLLSLAKDEPEDTKHIILSPDNPSDKSQPHPKVSLKIRKKKETEAFDLWE